MKRNYNYLFLIIWGALFGGIPLIIICTTKIEGPTWFLFIFIVIGLVAMGFGIKNLVKKITDKNILKKGKDGIGQFITQKGYGSINNMPMFKIEFSFKNDNSEICQVTTNELYTYDEVEIFRNNKNIKIKYSGDKAVIISTQAPDIAITKYHCQYCGQEFDGEICPSCGARK